MGLVLDEIVRRVRAQVDQRGLVLWFDPERHYAGVVDRLAAEGLPVLRATDGYFALRRALDPWLDAPTRPAGLVWVPRPEEEGAHALCELASVAAVMSPSASAAAQNTRLASVLRAALPRSVAPEVRKAVVAQAEGGRLGLDELDALVSQSGQGVRAALAVVFPTTDPMELALRHLAGMERDAALVDKGLVDALADAVGPWLGAPLDESHRSPAALRDALALHAFVTVWRARYGAEKPAPEIAERCAALLTAWRDRLGAREEYVRQARRVASLLGEPPRDAPMDALEAEESFPTVDDALAEGVEAAMEGDAASHGHEARCGRARRRFWSQMEPSRMERFALLESVARVRRLAGEVSRSLRAAREADVAAVSSRYVEGAGGEAPWSALDTAHRHMERQHANYDGAPAERDARLDRLLAAARHAYATVTEEVAARWLRAVSAAGFAVPGVRRQRETFARYVRPLLDEGTVAYVLVDGLRYEMARELVDALKDLGDPALAWTVGTLPSVTEVGMAALLPGAERGAALDVGRDGRLGLALGGALLRTRKERMEHLAREVPGAVVFKLGDVVPTKRGLRERVAQAPLVVVTVTDELDGLGDGVNAEMARRFMDDALSQVRRAVKVLFQLGVRHAVVTADHGHLFGESLASDRQIPSPGGDAVALHRRVWVGRGGASDAAFGRFAAGTLGLDGDLTVAVPWGTACFTAPGAVGGYFHGGGSPQELVVPVLTVRSSGVPAPAENVVRWTIAPTRSKLTALVATVLVGGEVEGLFAAPERRVRVEVREGRKTIGRPSAAAYGFDEATREVALAYDAATRSFRANTVTVRLDAAPEGRRVRVVLLDARTDQELAAHELDVALASW